MQPGFMSFDPDDIEIVADVKKKYEEKLTLFHEIIERWPDQADAYYHIACIYARGGRLQDSIQQLNQAIKRGFNRWELIKTDSDLSALRNFREFQILATSS